MLPDTVTTSTLTVQSSVTEIASSMTFSPSASTASGLGGFIMQGLNDPSSSTASANTESLSRTTNLNATVDWKTCQTSQVAWSEAWSSAYDPRVVTNTTTYTHNIDTITFNVTFGRADVYTTIDGIPHAHGELKPTSTSQSIG